MMKEYTAAAAVLVLVMFTTSCDAGSFVEPGLEGGDPNDPATVQVEDLVLDSLPSLISEDDTIHLGVTALDPDGDPIEQRLDVEWSSSDESVASFGTMTGTGADLLTKQPGTTTITASYEQASAAMTIEVHNRPVDLVYVAGSSQQGAPGTQLPDSLTVRAVDKRGDPVSGVYLDFVVTAGGGTVSPTGGTTDPSGLLSAAWTLGESDNQVVEARASQAQARVKHMKDSVVVFTAQIADTTSEGVSAAAVVVSPEADTVAIQATTHLAASVYDHNGNALANRRVAWSSSDANIATVDGEGVVTGVGEGQVVVSATAEGASDSASITVAGSAGGTLAVSPAADTLYGVGDTTTLTAEARAADGSLISDPGIQWSSQDTSIATVDSMGTVTAKALGIAVIAASAVCCDSGDFVEVTVVDDTTSVGTAVPGTVADLSVVATGEDSVTLEWTQVEDGTGNPADYALRYGSPTLEWGSAYDTEVSVEGTAVGEAATYTFAGLAASTNYEFQLVSYRGTLNDGATFGEASNLVGATTDGVAQANVTISPSSLTLETVGDTRTLSAEAREADGSLASNPEITWTSSDPTIAAVNSEGMVTARALGTAVIVASSVCCGDARADVRVGQNALHPNEPAGMTVIANADGSIAHNADGAFGEPNFSNWYGHVGGGEQYVSVEADARNPTGSGYKVRFDWDADGREAAIGSLDLVQNFTTVYISHRVELPTCWSGYGHKWFYMIPNGESNWGTGLWTSQEINDDIRVIDGRNLDVISYGDTDPLTVFAPRNEIIEVEYVFVAESAAGARDGEVYIYVDGNLVASATNGQWYGADSYETNFNRLQYYMHANEAPANCHIWVHEFYVSGK